MTLSRYFIAILILFICTDSLKSNPEDWSKKRIQQDNNNCYHKGHKLYGRIQIVNSFPDLKVQVVTSFPDLQVKVVNNQPARCGEWKIVNEFPDLKVQFVNSFPDIKIQFVQSFPGRPRSK